MLLAQLTMASRGTVYLLRHGSTDIYKIGRTRDATVKRLANLATGNPEKLRVVKEWTVPERHGEFERLLHLTFNQRRIRKGDATEFFDFTGVGESDVARKIDDTLDQFTERLKWLSRADVEQDSAELITPTESTDHLVAEHHRLHGQIKLMQMECAGVDAQLKAQIGGAGGVGHPDRDRPSVTWRTTKTTRFDMQRFKADHPELHAKYSTQMSFRTFRVHE